MFRITTEEDYFIHLTTWDVPTPEEEELGVEPEFKNVWKWCTGVYADDDISIIIIKHKSELPLGAEVVSLI